MVAYNGQVSVLEISESTNTYEMYSSFPWVGLVGKAKVMKTDEGSAFVPTLKVAKRQVWVYVPPTTKTKPFADTKSHKC